jgi:hypothetical protein
MFAAVCPGTNPPASLLAIAISANGRVDPREVAELDRLGAYDLLGIQRDFLLQLAGVALQEIGVPLSETRWLRLVHRSCMLKLQYGVPDTLQRLLICRLTEAVIRADGEISGGEWLIYATMLHHWGLTQAVVSEARISHGALESTIRSQCPSAPVPQCPSAPVPHCTIEAARQCSN